MELSFVSQSLVGRKDNELLFFDVAWTFEKGNDNNWYACVTSITIRTGADSQTPFQSIYCRRGRICMCVCVYCLQGNALIN